jgi:hypothetical protein
MLLAADMADVILNSFSNTQCTTSAITSLMALFMLFLVCSRYFIRVTLLISSGEVPGSKHGLDSNYPD